MGGILLVANAAQSIYMTVELPAAQILACTGVVTIVLAVCSARSIHNRHQRSACA